MVGKEGVPELGSDGSSSDGAGGWILVNARILVGLIGAVSCFSWLFVMLGTSIFIPFADLEGVATGAAHLAFLGGCCTTLLACWRFSDWLSAHRIVQVILAAAFTLAGCVGFSLYELAATWYGAFGFVLGCGFSLIYPLYGEYICLFFHSDIKPYIVGIFAASVFMCTGLLFSGPDTSFLFAIIFPAVAISAYAVAMVLLRLDTVEGVKAKASDKRSQVVWRSYLATATSGMAAGFALGCILSTQNAQSGVFVLIEVALLGTCIGLLVDSLHKNFANETATMRLFLPFSAVVVFPLLFVPEEIRYVFAVLLLCGSIFPTTCSLSAICRHVVLCDLSAIRAFSFGRLICFGGIALGMIISFAGFSELAVQAIGSTATILSIILFMVLVIFSASFVMTEDNYPDRDRFKQAEVKAGSGEGEAVLVAGPGTPIRRLAGEPAVSDEPEVIDEGRLTRPGIFYLKCDAVAKRYDLSNRQKEVLVMLAKGRNAEYITEKLVISSHTAKAHIYNIYQKTGVHSRQELMDLVEEMEIELPGSD
ncbi:response regulator transcription factor [Raoultibacter phocaeensis]|uniref:response regulator transcription factor n=1 Tax=Raoultibacter phocaeensis TaxID=2479841 RepID=UPI00210645D2|nr:helix-turn-helix transcriptional regulator [Raoultibacter phocaeensis]